LKKQKNGLNALNAGVNWKVLWLIKPDKWNSLNRKEEKNI